MVFYTFKPIEKYTKIDNVSYRSEKILSAYNANLFNGHYHFLTDIYKNNNFNENDLMLFLNQYKIKGFKGLVSIKDKERINYNNDYYRGKLNKYFPFNEKRCLNY